MRVTEIFSQIACDHRSIESPEFWAKSVAIVERKLDAFEASLDELGL